MTTYDYGTGTPPQTTGLGGADGDGTAAAAQRAKETAADEARHVADVAKDEARSVAQEAQEQARDVLDEARAQVDQESRKQLDNLVSTLQGFADDLEQMARGDGAGAGLARDVVGQVSDRARTVSAQLQGREPSEVLDEVRDFARRRPGLFLAGALGAGVVVGRLARGAKDAGSSSATSSTSTSSTAPGMPATPTMPAATPPAAPVPGTGGTAAGEPLAGTPTPAERPVYPQGSASAPGGTL